MPAAPAAAPAAPAATIPEAFIAHWQKAAANERANSQSFLLGLTQLLGVPAPSNSHADGYSFEFPVKVPGGTSTNFLSVKQSWPKPLAERIRATEQALHATGKKATAVELAQHFARAKPEDLQEILDSLVTLGRAQRDGERFGI